MSSAIKTVQTTRQENFAGFGHQAASEEHQFNIDNVPDQSGKIAIVTGGSEGIGYACTRTLLEKNIGKLFVLSLSQDVVNGAYDALEKGHGQGESQAR